MHMGEPDAQMEGPWEVIVRHSARLAGRRVRLTVVPDADTAAREDATTRTARMLERVAALRRVPVTPQEAEVLEGLGQQARMVLSRENAP